MIAGVVFQRVSIQSLLRELGRNPVWMTVEMRRSAPFSRA